MKAWEYVLGFIVILAVVPWGMELFFKYCDLIHRLLR